MSQVNDDWWKRWIDTAGLDEITDPFVRWNCASIRASFGFKLPVKKGEELAPALLEFGEAEVKRCIKDVLSISHLGDGHEACFVEALTWAVAMSNHPLAIEVLQAIEVLPKKLSIQLEVSFETLFNCSIQRYHPEARRTVGAAGV